MPAVPLPAACCFCCVSRCAATACRRWHELATADSVWRVKARREGMVEKAGVFEVALPVVGMLKLFRWNK